MKYGKWLILLMALCLIISFAACGGGGGGGDEPDPPAPETPWLCFTASDDSTVSTKTQTEGTVSTPAPALEYSKDDGTTWTDFELSYYDAFGNLTTAGTTVPLASGEKMYIRAKSTNAAFSDYDGVNSRAIMFLMTGSIAASGNVMSLLDKDCKITVIPSNMCFYILFGDCDVLTSAPELPATSLKYCCYAEMFANCSALTSAPKLPATTLADGCYSCMFYGCSSLVSAPELLATVLTPSCYEGMFAECSALATVPTLPAITLADWCYSGMFDHCTSLVNAPEIKATSLPANSCYGMFARCSALTKITVHFTDWNTAGQATYIWVMETPASGDFYCPAGLADRTEDDSKVPTGWTVHDLP